MRCPYCLTENAPGATRCAACTSWLDARPVREWTRARSGRMIAGVARGLADRFGVPIAAVRLLFLAAILFGGWGVLVYLALWIAMPEAPAVLPAARVPVVVPEPGPRPDPAPSGEGAGHRTSP